MFWSWAGGPVHIMKNVPFIYRFKLPVYVLYTKWNGKKMKLPSIDSDLLYTGIHQGRSDCNLFSTLYI